MAEILLEAGADPSLQDHNLQMPRDLAARRNRKFIMAILIGSHVAAPDSTADPDLDALSGPENSCSALSEQVSKHCRTNPGDQRRWSIKESVTFKETVFL